MRSSRLVDLARSADDPVPAPFGRREAAAGPGARAPRPPGAPGPRRAHRRHGPGRQAGDPRAHRGAARGRDHDPPHHPRAGRCRAPGRSRRGAGSRPGRGLRDAGRAHRGRRPADPVPPVDAARGRRPRGTRGCGRARGGATLVAGGGRRPLRADRPPAAPDPRARRRPGRLVRGARPPDHGATPGRRQPRGAVPGARRGGRGRRGGGAREHERGPREPRRRGPRPGHREPARPASWPRMALALASNELRLAAPPRREPADHVRHPGGRAARVQRLRHDAAAPATASPWTGCCRAPWRWRSSRRRWSRSRSPPASSARTA